MRFFLDEILEYDELKESLLADPEACDKGKALAEKIIADQRYADCGEDSLVRLAAVAYLSDHALELHKSRGIPREITVATMKDVNVWVENYRSQYGVLGYKNLDWLCNHGLGNLFRLGRLQFVHAKALPVAPFGEYVLEVHIPQGEPLDIDACMKSFDMARAFFAKLYPDKPASHFVCGSWLLSPDIPNIAPENSNICRFMRLWTQLPHEGDKGHQAMERVFGFGFDAADIASAPEKTSLQRSLKAHILAGGTVESSFGCIEI